MGDNRESGRKLRVLLVSPKPPPAHGAAKAVETLLGGCSDSVEWVHVDSRYVTCESQLNKIRVRKFFLLIKYLWQTAFASRRCDVVILTPSFQFGTFFKDSLFVWVCKLFWCRRLVAWYHMRFATMGFDSRNFLVKWYVKRTLRRFTHHVCVAERLIDEMPDFIDRERISAVPNGIQEVARRDRDGGGDKLGVLYLSNMGEAKGWKILLEVGERLCERHPHVEFMFYGSPANETTLEDLRLAFADVAFPERIRYLGHAGPDEKERVFAEADCLCFPSLNDAFPITVLEAMSVGLPIIASDVGGVPDALEDGAGGVLVPPGDSDALEAALELLISDPNRRRAWGEFNRARFLERFTEEVYCDRWGSLLESLVE